MARTYTVQQIIDRVRLLTDTKNDTHITDADIILMADHAYPKTWALLYQISPPDYNITRVPFVTVPNQINYALNTIAPAGNFWKLKNLYVDEGNGQLRPIRALDAQNLQAYRAVQGTFTMQMDYIPCAPTLSLVSDIVDGINGWEDHMIALICQDIKKAKEEDASKYERAEAMVAAEMKKLGTRDAGQAMRVVRRKCIDPYLIYRNNVDGYIIQGANLNLYYRSGYYAVP